MDRQPPPIARFAADRGMSGRALGRVLGLPASTAFRILRGDRPLTLTEARRAATALGCDLTDLDAADAVA